MSKKENKGGVLTNEQVEQELQRIGTNDNDTSGYRGTQDTGDQTVRDLGTDVQQQDGRPPENPDKE